MPPLLREVAFQALSRGGTFRGLAPAFARSRAIVDSLACLFLPADCRICRQPLECFSAVPVCAACLAAPQPYRGAECVSCGLFFPGPANREQTLTCASCRHHPFVFEQARSFAAYEGTLAALIQRLKYDGYRPLAKPLGRYLAHAVERLRVSSFDLLLPVPLHPRRQRQRGFNQATVLASRLSSLLAVPLAAKDCVRVRDTLPQTRLRSEERRKNVAGAFHVPDPRRVRGRRVLLVDDVLTTGATANACADALRKGGAAGVWVVTLARARDAAGDGV